MRKHHLFTPLHPGVCPMLKSRLLWMAYSVTASGGAYISAKRLKARFCPSNEAAAIAITSPLTLNPN